MCKKSEDSESVLEMTMSWTKVGFVKDKSIEMLD